MSTVFLYCAAIGGTILVLQFLMLLLGAGGDHDGGHAHAGTDFGDGLGDGHVDVGHDQASFLKLLSLQTVSTFATFFGLIGLATEGLAWSPIAVVGAATMAGATALWFVAKLMHSLARLQSSGTVDLKNAIGHTANVYLRIPAQGLGHGRVMLQVQGRTVECTAVTRGDEIPTGAEVRVVEHKDGDMLVVEPA